MFDNPVLRSAKRAPANVRRLNNRKWRQRYCLVGERSRALALLNEALYFTEQWATRFGDIAVLTVIVQDGDLTMCSSKILPEKHKVTSILHEMPKYAKFGVQTRSNANWPHVYDNFLFVWGFSSHSRFFTHMETSLLLGKGCTFWPILGTHGYWAMRILLCATPTLTMDIHLYWSSWRTCNTRFYCRAFTGGVFNTWFNDFGLRLPEFQHPTFGMQCDPWYYKEKINIFIAFKPFIW